MFRTWSFVVALVAAPSVVAVAQKFEASAYAVGGKIVDLKTGSESVLLPRKPVQGGDCAPGTYYQARFNVVVRCDTGERFELIAPAIQADIRLPSAAKILKPLPPGTDDPGPSFKP